MTLKCIRAALRALLLPMLVAASVSVQAGPFSGIYVFGDSLSDTGNLSLVTAGTQNPQPNPTQPYDGGRFSDGALWVEGLAWGLGLGGQASPYLLGGNNYAYAGARTGTALTPPGVLAQVAGIWGPAVGVADPDALYVVVGGGNDMRDARLAFQGDTAADTLGRDSAAAVAIAGLSQAIQYLAASGARHVLIANLPDLGNTPEAALLGLKAASTAASGSFNSLVPNLFGLEAFFPGLNIELIDMAGIANHVLLNAEDFGVTNTDRPCGSFFFSLGADCANSLFSDVLHPSALVHGLFAQAALGIYGVPLPGTLALLMLALLALVVVQRGRGRGVQASGTVSC